MITPARRSTLHEVITNEIVELIIQGEWKPGERIPGEIYLSEQFQVSRNSVRESIKALELFGLFKSMPGKGTYISENAFDRIQQLRYTASMDDFDPQGFLVELLETRLVVEPGLCWMAANFATQETLNKMESLIERSLNAIDHNEYHFDLGMAFHEELYYSTSNQILINLFLGMKERFMIARREVYFKLTETSTLVEELHDHKDILLLIKDKKGVDAANAMREHLFGPLQRLKRHIDKQNK